MHRFFIAGLLATLIVAPVSLAAEISSNGTGGGPWFSASTWAGAVVPLSTDDVVILLGDTVTLNSALVDASVQVQGTLQITAGTVLVNGSIEIAPGGLCTVASGGLLLNPGAQLLVQGELQGQNSSSITNNGGFQIDGSGVVRFTGSSTLLGSG
ncbi:MAG: hypothetical protein RLZZ303_1429, partial [Candidatus Hydrogenedentota bacterium]